MKAEIVPAVMFEATLLIDGTTYNAWVRWVPDDLGGAFEKLEALLRDQGVKDIAAAMATVSMCEYRIH